MTTNEETARDGHPKRLQKVIHLAQGITEASKEDTITQVRNRLSDRNEVLSNWCDEIEEEIARATLMRDLGLPYDDILEAVTARVRLFQEVEAAIAAAIKDEERRAA